MEQIHVTTKLSKRFLPSSVSLATSCSSAVSHSREPEKMDFIDGDQAAPPKASAENTIKCVMAPRCS